MHEYIASIDQGTTSTRCMIFNHQGEPDNHDIKGRKVI